MMDSEEVATAAAAAVVPASTADSNSTLAPIPAQTAVQLNEPLRVLVLSLNVYRDQLDEYLGSLCDQGPFCDDPEPLVECVAAAEESSMLPVESFPVHTTTTTTTTTSMEGSDTAATNTNYASPPLDVRRHFLIHLPRAHSSHVETLDLDMILCEPVQREQLKSIMNADFLAQYRGVTFAVSGNRDANLIMFDPSTVNLRLAEELKAEWLLPLAKHIRNTSEMLPMSIFAIDVEDTASSSNSNSNSNSNSTSYYSAFSSTPSYNPFGWDIFKCMVGGTCAARSHRVRRFAPCACPISPLSPRKSIVGCSSSPEI
jgi:hypothetical protein